MQMNQYKVTFGNPRKEPTLSLIVRAPNEQSAMIEARLDPAYAARDQLGFGKSGKISSVRLVKALC